MLDPIADVAFAQEAIAKLLLSGQLGVQDFDRYTFAVAVARGVDRGCPTDSKQTLEPPFVAEECAYALLRELFQLGLIQENIRGESSPKVSAKNGVGCLRLNVPTGGGYGKIEYYLQKRTAQLAGSFEPTKSRFRCGTG